MNTSLRKPAKATAKVKAKTKAPLRRLAPMVMALAATLIGAPGYAVDVPGLPLQTGTAYPPPNIMFILDDSGSMEYVAMPRDITSWSKLDDDITDKSYINNTIYYNPETTYLPWIGADGSRRTGGTSYTSAYSDANLASGSTTDLSSNTQTYFVPKSASVDLTDQANYYRYQIRKVNGSVRVVRSVYSTKKGSEGESGAGCNEKANNWQNCGFTPPMGRTEAKEMENFATWYSYYRTRMKVAKAGASEAFSQLGSNMRVGYDSIWNKKSYPIPVGAANKGIFEGTNRSTWFSRMQAAEGSSTTPLKGALQRTGKYFEDTSSTGPWAPDQISCRQNFAILTTDGYWNSDSGFSSVGDVDGTDGPKITSKDGKTTYQYKPASPYSDNFKGSPNSQPNTLADVAMHYWNRDLAPSLDNNVPTSPADPAFWQHMVTFGVSIGLKGRLDSKKDLPSIINGSKNWGDPTDAEDLDRIDDLWHASVNGRGNFVAASDPKEFAQGLVNALATVAARQGSASNVTANSTSFQSDTRVFQASYVAGKWIGELAAYDVSSAGVADKDKNGSVDILDSNWTASKGIPTSKRNVQTWDGSTGAPFPTTAQKTSLDQSARALAPATADENVAYLLGDQTREKKNGGVLRDRDTVLGDIVNSSPMYIKDSETIFVGANDGMLHAFDATNGKERFAYVPAGISFAKLATLSDPQYVHDYFVDGPVVVSTTKQTTGKNYLVGALGRGGKGVFGLDVTSPGSFAKKSVLWDKTGTAVPANMGHVLGDPLIVKLNSGANGVIVSNGINSTTGTASLFVLNIDTGAVLAELDTGVTGDNGLSAPRGADLDGNGTVDYVYAGDLKGNVWKFNLKDVSSKSWTIDNGGKPLFTAQDAGGKRQPITSGVAIARHPTTSQVWVFVGTGSFMTATDVGDASVQSMYGLVDDGVITSRDELTKRTIVTVTTQDGRSVRAFEQHSKTMVAGKRGWYIDLNNPKAGERIVSNPNVRGQVLLTASMIPPTTDTCDAGGSGYINALDAFTGTSTEKPYFDNNRDDQFDDKDTVKDKDGNPLPIGSVDVGVGMPTLPTIIDKLLVVGGSKGTLADMKVNPQGGSPRRISWRELMRD